MSLSSPTKLGLHPYKKSTILVLGDHGCGKTTFLKRFCKEIPDKKLNKSSSKINIYLKRQLIERSSLSSSETSSLKTTIEFIELCGEKNYKDAMSFYVSQLLICCSAIFYFFDLTNMKSLFNFYMWMKFLIESWSQNQQNQGENPLWERPFLILAGKRNLINDFDYAKSEIDEYFRGIFGCVSGENVVYLQKSPKKIDLNEVFLEAFLREICIEDILKEQNAVDLRLMQCDLKKYWIKKENLLKNLLVNTIARETLANLYWQFVNYLWGYYKNFKKFMCFAESVKKEIKKID